MFHVKLDKKNPFGSLVDELLQNRFFSVSGLPGQALPSFFSLAKKRSLVLLDSFEIKDVVRAFEKRIGVDVACLSRDRAVAPSGFLEYYGNLFSLSKNFVSASPSSVFLCFVDRALAEKKIFQRGPLESFLIKDSCDFDSLLASLESFKYPLLRSSHLLNGSYRIQGGLVDVCPVGSPFTYRVSFIQKKTKIYQLNKEGLIKVPVRSFLLPHFKKEESVDVFDFLGSSFKKISYKKGVLYNSNLVSGSKIVVFVDVVDFQRFHDLRGSVRFAVCSLLKSSGYFINKSFMLIPSWFVNKEAPLSVPLVLSEGSRFVVGDFYTHVDFGLCKFLGLEEPLKGRERVCLKFSDGVVRLDVSLIYKLYFFSSSSRGTSLGFLNRPAAWKKTKQRAYNAAKLYAEDLVLFYKKRRGLSRKPFLVSKKLLNEFVLGFQYKETVDQKSSWEDISKDLFSNKPMTRLLCGDVGFGKTEIAIRAAFVVSFCSQTTLVLAPTTILATQLFNCFNKRLSPYGIRVGLALRSSKHKNNPIMNTINKKIDVLIGTHFILKNPNLLKGCSLFIVDEEHRFGVKDKEGVFKHNPSVDYLSLSATPIPRTLQMALANKRNISLIQTPPVSRQKIVSQVCLYDFNLVVDFICYEINRSGQVYFVDNSVNNVLFYFKKLSSLFPSISFAAIYGALPVEETKKTMSLFVARKIDVLFSTTIIESGIDVPSVNSIIINNAHLFGLSQLYQLRGRVGRSSTQSFSYFLIPKSYNLTSGAKRRLASIAKHTSLGSGYYLALDDLNVRGAGALFGYGQTGFSGVGFDFYSKIVGDVLNLKFSSSPPLFFDCFVNVFGGKIPKHYIEEDGLRSQYYKSIFSSTSPSALSLIKKNLVREFGLCHPKTLLLIKDRLLGLRAAPVGIESIVQKEGACVVVFSSAFYKNSLPSLFSLIKNLCKKLSINYIFKSSKKSLNLECFVNKKTASIFIDALIGKLIK